MKYFEELTESQQNKIAHTLGVNLYHAKLSTSKKDKFLPASFYRNYYYLHQRESELDELVNEGYMHIDSKFNGIYYFVTDSGQSRFRNWFKNEITEKFTPLSKSKQVYDDYIHSEICEDFAFYLNITPPKRIWGDDVIIGGKRKHLRKYVSEKYHGVEGEFKPFEKEAKISYKEALMRYKRNNSIT